MGFDANALYLGCIGQDMPVGPYIRRHADNCFIAERSEKFTVSYNWLNYLIESEDRKISHYLNAGVETRILGYPVDGFEKSTDDTSKGTIYQFHGKLNNI